MGGNQLWRADEVARCSRMYRLSRDIHANTAAGCGGASAPCWQLTSRATSRSTAPPHGCKAGQLTISTPKNGFHSGRNVGCNVPSLSSCGIGAGRSTNLLLTRFPLWIRPGWIHSAAAIGSSRRKVQSLVLSPSQRECQAATRRYRVPGMSPAFVLRPGDAKRMPL